MRRRLRVAVLGACVLVAGLLTPGIAYGAGEAPGAPGGGAAWTTGDKAGLGTSTTAASRTSTAWCGPARWRP